jgi:tetratricopeptide (TPR) repeat protein
VWLARAVAAQGRPFEAAPLAATATELAPDWAAGWCALGEAWAAAGREDQALQAYERALDCSAPSLLPGAAPDDTAWQVRAGIARIHLAREHYAAAADVLGHAVALHPASHELRVMLAQAYEGAGRSAEAKAQLERAVSGPPSGAEAHLAFGDFFTRKAEEALLRGLVDNAENRALLVQIERLREVRRGG